MKLLRKIDKTFGVIQIAAPYTIVQAMQGCGRAQVNDGQTFIGYPLACGKDIFRTVELGALGKIKLSFDPRTRSPDNPALTAKSNISVKLQSGQPSVEKESR